MAHDLQSRGVPFVRIVFAWQPKITFGRAISDLELIAKASDPEEMVSRVQYIPL